MATTDRRARGARATQAADKPLQVAIYLTMDQYKELKTFCELAEQTTNITIRHILRRVGAIASPDPSPRGRYQRVEGKKYGRDPGGKNRAKLEGEAPEERDEPQAEAPEARQELETPKETITDEQANERSEADSIIAELLGL